MCGEADEVRAVDPKIYPFRVGLGVRKVATRSCINRGKPNLARGLRRSWCPGDRTGSPGHCGRQGVPLWCQDTAGTEFEQLQGWKKSFENLEATRIKLYCGHA